MLAPDSFLSSPPYPISVPHPLRYTPFRSLPLNPIVYLPASSRRAPALDLFPHHLRILLFYPGCPADAANNPSRRPDAPCNRSSPPGAHTIYHVRQTSSAAHLVGRTSPATYPFDHTSHTTSPVGLMSYNVLLAFDRPPDTFPRLLNLQNLQLPTRRRAHSCASSNHPADTSRRGSRISSPADHPLRASTLLQFCYFRASWLPGAFAMCIIYSITPLLCIHNILIIV